ncbi:hypothetical protein [Nonomuraea roseoviolacea]|uniref:Uncharacterized protein n=1 Tax=Nonomuraea roseoviolacea subsp. carminata TaxID=160689 RepID=A0ABT1KCK9_9ACTN|nr:hypothetical protein [Nonomuraea roseoviolacea]MCP2351685.1 hypothetical protein [Nonomuraea roseoviolacea subsp. carminata]
MRYARRSPLPAAALAMMAMALAPVLASPAHADEQGRTAQRGIITAAHADDPVETPPDDSEPDETALGGDTVHTEGYEARFYIRSGGCEGWVYTKKRSGHWYAKGVIRSRRNHCLMLLETRHGSGGYVQVSNEYRAINETMSTGYHWDDRGYSARVCIQNYDNTEEQYRCGRGV